MEYLAQTRNPNSHKRDDVLQNNIGVMIFNKKTLHTYSMCMRPKMEHSAQTRNPNSHKRWCHTTSYWSDDIQQENTTNILKIDNCSDNYNDIKEVNTGGLHLTSRPKHQDKHSHMEGLTTMGDCWTDAAKQNWLWVYHYPHKQKWSAQ